MIHFVFFFFFKDFIYLLDRERGQAGGTADWGWGRSRLPTARWSGDGARSQDPGIMTWAEGRHLTDWAAQVPPFCMLFYLWCRVWIQVHSFCIWISSCPRTICWKGCIFFTSCHLHLRQDQLTIYVWVYLWALLCPIDLCTLHYTNIMLFNYYQFIIIFELRWLVLVLQFCSLSGFFCYSRSFVFPHEFYLFYLFILSTCIVESTCHFLREKTLVVFWKSGLDYVEFAD